MQTIFALSAVSPCFTADRDESEILFLYVHIARRCVFVNGRCQMNLRVSVLGVAIWCFLAMNVK